MANRVITISQLDFSKLVDFEKFDKILTISLREFSLSKFFFVQFRISQNILALVVDSRFYFSNSDAFPSVSISTRNVPSSNFYLFTLTQSVEKCSN
jgi:hypothetical protein